MGLRPLWNDIKGPTYEVTFLDRGFVSKYLPTYLIVIGYLCPKFNFAIFPPLWPSCYGFYTDLQLYLTKWQPLLDRHYLAIRYN